MLKTKYIAVVLVCLLTACTQPKKHTPPKEHFTMYITDDGVKQFQLSLAKQGNKQRSKKGGRSHRGGRGNKDKRNMGNYNVVKPDHQNDKIEERIEYHLFKTAYCRDGYIEIEQLKTSDEIIFKGRCHEKASPKDRKKFSQ